MILDTLYFLLIFPIAEIIELAFEFFYRGFFDSYGPSIIALSFFVTLASLPIYMVAEKWQETERKKVQSMAPRISILKQAFHGDERFMLISAYYRENNYKPIYALRSSFSILIQIPFFLAAYKLLSSMDVLNGVSFWFLKDLGKPDGMLQIGNKSFNMLPIAMTLINCISGAIYSKGHPMREKVQIYGMAAIFLVLLYSSPSALLMYWTMNNVLSLVKNIFYKLKRPVLALYITSIAIVGFMCLYLGITGNYRMKRCIAILILVTLLPVFVKLFKIAYKATIGRIEMLGKTSTRLTVTSLCAVMLLIGAIIPLNLIASSPTEFSFIGEFDSPLVFVYFTLVQSIGMFIVWPICLYHLFSSKKTKSVFCYIAVTALFVCILDFYVFFHNFGSLDSSLFFTNIEMIESPSKKIQLLNIICIFVLAILILILFRYKKLSWLQPVVYILIAAAVTFGIVQTIRINSEYQNYARIQNDPSTTVSADTQSFDPVFHFSTTEKNVLIIMLDRAISGYVPYIFNEKASLKSSYDGFIYYPNTVSSGKYTNYGTPPLLGGYDFTLDKMQERKDTLLKDKQNEALSILPLAFSENNMDSYIFNPPYPDYQKDYDPISGIPFKNIPRTEAVPTSVKYLSWWSKNNFESGKRESALLKYNLFKYSIMEVLPSFMRLEWYNDGKWRNEFKPELESFVLSNYSLSQYATLAALPYITEIETGNDGCYNFIDSDLTHNPIFLQAPDYVPTIDKPDNTSVTVPYIDDAHYSVNAAAFRLLDTWFDYLKEKGVYDNTRIIIVSDHGRYLPHETEDDVILPDGSRLEEVRALLMVKDFNSRGEVSTDNTFMTVADVPSMAVDSVADSFISPYTENTIVNREEEKNSFLVEMKGSWNSLENPKLTQFEIPDDGYSTVHDNIFDVNNWQQVTMDY